MQCAIRLHTVRHWLYYNIMFVSFLIKTSISIDVIEICYVAMNFFPLTFGSGLKVINLTKTSSRSFLGNLKIYIFKNISPWYQAMTFTLMETITHPHTRYTTYLVLKSACYIMGTISALLALCEEKSYVNFPHKQPGTRSFNVFFVVSPNNRVVGNLGNHNAHVTPS